MTNALEEQGDLESKVNGVIRGELPLRELREIGVEIDSQDGSLELNSGKLNVEVAPTVLDVALGLLRYGSSILDRDDLRKWSFFLLAESGVIDLGKVESDPDGAFILSALWDASFGEGVGSEAIETAEKIIRNSRTVRGS